VFSAKLGHFLDKPLAPIAKRIALSPNVLTVSGFLITVIAAVSIPVNLVAAGFLILLGSVFDVLDGVVARATGKTSRFGAFLDSTLDRYSDAFLFLAIAWHFNSNADITAVAVTLGSLIGALLTSYVRARAEGLGIDCHVGLVERPERLVMLCLGCITGWMFPIMIILLFLSHATVLHRVMHVRKMTKE
jgi:phosphatidylglycerophosphate synthase